MGRWWGSEWVPDWHFRCGHCDHDENKHKTSPGWEPHYDDGPWDPVKRCHEPSCKCPDYEYPTAKSTWDHAVMALSPEERPAAIAKLKADLPDWDWSVYEAGFEGRWPPRPEMPDTERRSDV